MQHALCRCVEEFLSYSSFILMRRVNFSSTVKLRRSTGILLMMQVWIFRIDFLFSQIQLQTWLLFPVRTKINSSQKPVVNWFNAELREMRERLHTLYSVRKTYPNLISKDEISGYKKTYKAEIVRTKKRAHDLYIENSNNPQIAMWNVIKSKK